MAQTGTEPGRQEVQVAPSERFDGPATVKRHMRARAYRPERHAPAPDSSHEMTANRGRLDDGDRGAVRLACQKGACTGHVLRMTMEQQQE